MNYIQSKIDITDGIQKYCLLIYCKDCGRIFETPNHWIEIEKNSNDFLKYCLRKVTGLHRVKLVDARICKFDWFSQKANILLTIQKEVSTESILQQSFVVDIYTEFKNCNYCNFAKSESEFWDTSVQVRQNVEHKRTFLMLEQLIIKHGADVDCIQITKKNKGLDFFFNKKSLSLRFIEFLQKMVPIRLYADSKKLLSHDSHNNTYRYRYGISVEIVPICKEDLVYLAKQLRLAVGSSGPLMLCTRVTNIVQLIDPTALKILHLDSKQYWKSPLNRIMHSDQLQEVIVLNVEPLNKFKSKFQLAEIEIAKSSDFGYNDKIFYVSSHLGNVLRTGDNALGYDITTISLVEPDNDEAYEPHKKQLPDIILVRKSYSKQRQERKSSRIWKLRQLEILEDESDIGQERKFNPLQDEVDHERFLEEIEEDVETRSRIALYMDLNAMNARKSSKSISNRIDFNQDEVPEVPLEDLVETMKLDYNQKEK